MRENLLLEVCVGSISVCRLQLGDLGGSACGCGAFRYCGFGTLSLIPRINFDSTSIQSQSHFRARLIPKSVNHPDESDLCQSGASVGLRDLICIVREEKRLPTPFCALRLRNTGLNRRGHIFLLHSEVSLYLCFLNSRIAI